MHDKRQGPGCLIARRPPPLPPAPWAFSCLDEHVLLHILRHLQPADLQPAHLVSRTWRQAVQLSTQALSTRSTPQSLDQRLCLFPNLSSLSLLRMDLTDVTLQCITQSLPRLTALHLRCRRLHLS